MATLYIISGCNGAGKTTASFTLLPDIMDCKEFVNADEIAKGLSPFQPEKAAIDAGRIMIKRMEDLLMRDQDFAIETTLATKSYHEFIQRAHARGYKVTLIYFWLNSVELAIERVRARVATGGHHIPEETIRRRYISGNKNLSDLYLHICDEWLIIDNSTVPPEVVANKGQNEAPLINNPELFKTITGLDSI
ncbi:MAG: zeta toxin [Bacteroidales bacterium 45-6]|nr:MAG: zeta toxin [Bacteroidales bacterium 45-6]